MGQQHLSRFDAMLGALALIALLVVIKWAGR